MINYFPLSLQAEMAYQLAPGEKLVSCPFDISHHIRTVKLGSHLMKCRQNYYKKILKSGRAIDMHRCKFNSGHQFPLIELSYHEEMCSDRENILPPLPTAPYVEFCSPTQDDLCKFKRLATRAKEVIGEDWEIESIMHPTPKFAYNQDDIEMSHKKAAECAALGVFTHDRAAQPSPIPNEDDPTDELDYIFQDSDDDDEDNNYNEE